MSGIYIVDNSEALSELLHLLSDSQQNTSTNTTTITITNKGSSSSSSSSSHKAWDGEPLQDITRAVLCSSRLSTIPPLSPCINLNHLNLSLNLIKDISSLTLQSYSNLTHLDLSHNRLSSIEPVQSLLELRILRIQNNLIANLQPLISLLHLQELNCEYNRLHWTELYSLMNLPIRILSSHFNDECDAEECLESFCVLWCPNLIFFNSKAVQRPKHDAARDAYLTKLYDEAMKSRETGEQSLAKQSTSVRPPLPLHRDIAKSRNAFHDKSLEGSSNRSSRVAIRLKDAVARSRSVGECVHEEGGLDCLVPRSSGSSGMVELEGEDKGSKGLEYGPDYAHAILDSSVSGIERKNAGCSRAVDELYADVKRVSGGNHVGRNVNAATVVSQLDDLLKSLRER